MTDSYTAGPEERLSDLCSDVLVAAHLARARRLRPDYADALAMRVRSASADMVEPGDAQLLRSTATALSQISTRIKAIDVVPRVKAASPAAGPSIREMIAELDKEQMASAGPFDRNGSEERERQRVENENARLAEIARRAEEQRRR